MAKLIKMMESVFPIIVLLEFLIYFFWVFFIKGKIDLTGEEAIIVGTISLGLMMIDPNFDRKTLLTFSGCAALINLGLGFILFSQSQILSILFFVNFAFYMFFSSSSIFKGG